MPADSTRRNGISAILVLCIKPVPGTKRRFAASDRLGCYWRHKANLWRRFATCPLLAHRVESLRCEGSDAMRAKRTCRERRKRVDLTKMTHLRHKLPILL
jgi:hypothetical protein